MRTRYIILEHLYLNKRKMTAPEIAKNLNLTQVHTQTTLARLHKYVHKKKINGLYHYWIPQHEFKWVYNRINYFRSIEGGVEIEDEIGLDTDSEQFR